MLLTNAKMQTWLRLTFRSGNLSFWCIALACKRGFWLYCLLVWWHLAEKHRASSFFFFLIIISKSTGRDLAVFWKHFIFSILRRFLTFIKDFNCQGLSHLISLNTHKRKNSQSKWKVSELCFILLTMRTFKWLENNFLLFWMIEVKDRHDLLDHCEHFLDSVVLFH